MAEDRAWCIVYADGSTYSDADGPPEEAPGTGVLLIVCADPHVGRLILGGATAYGWHDDRGDEPPWDQHDQHGVTLYLAEPGWRKLVFGVSVSDALYRERYEQALALPGFQPKSGLRWEQPEAPEPRGE